MFKSLLKTSLVYFTFLGFFVLWGNSSSAQNGPPWKTLTRVGGVFSTFSSDEHKGLSAGSTGFGAEVSILKGDWKLGNLVGKARALYITGQEEFLDGTTERDLNFTMFNVEPAIGFQFNLMPFAPPGFRVYVSALGVGSYNQLNFSKSATLTELTKSDTALGGGYELGVGVEIYFKRMAGFWVLFGETQYRSVTMSLVEQSQFQLNGLLFVGGVGW